MNYIARHFANVLLILSRIFLFIAFFGLGFIVIRFLFVGLYQDDRNSVIALLLLWAFLAYIYLPQVHRRLSSLYLPDYFIGRVRTTDGLLGDPVNLAVIGSKKNLIDAFTNAGWSIAEELNWKTTIKMTKYSILKKSYQTAPVSSLFLFQKRQDITFQIEVAGNPHARHHVRFWKTPKNWWLPGGHYTDWLGAATYDRRVGFSFFTGQFTHKIEENVDLERDFVVDTIVKANRNASSERAEHFMTAFRSRNGGGDRITTDGALLFLLLDQSI